MVYSHTLRLSSRLYGFGDTIQQFCGENLNFLAVCHFIP
jgi:hypothetical protein